jgi:Icc-related predicted phosphoesterase
MKILFSSDIHGLDNAYVQFARSLHDNFDVGVLSGDMLYDELTEDESERIFPSGAPTDFLIRGLTVREQEIRKILNTSEKPIFLIPGNHDLTEWQSQGNITNISNRRVERDGLNFVGYRYTVLDRSFEDIRIDMLKLDPLVDENTILVTHSPPYGTLDANPEFGGTLSLGLEGLKHIVERRKPLCHLFGHIHAAAGVAGNAINGAYPLIYCFCGIDTDKQEIRTVR